MKAQNQNYRIKRYIVLLLVAIGFFSAALFAAGYLLNIPPYTNMTANQFWAEEERVSKTAEQACWDQGGTSFIWGGGGCVPLYNNFKFPDLPWYVVPQRNPWYDPAIIATMFLGIGVFVDFFLLIVLGIEWWPWRLDPLYN